MSKASEFRTRLREEIGRVVFGADDVIHGIALALLAKGHLLVQGVPGLGKTLLSKTLAGCLGGTFRRVQCTPDLMPADIIGTNVYRQDTGRFEFVQGPLFADVLLVDEINRTGPKTQAALLEAMEEGHVSMDRTTHRLPDDFLVIATQNPHEFEGTYPLPESQLDRFLLRIDIDYPARKQEERVLRAYDRPGGGHGAGAESPPLDESMLTDAREEVAAVHVSDALYDYVLDLAAGSRRHGRVSLGLSTRGALSVIRCARAEAAMGGADHVTPDDVKAVARKVMPHRLVLTPDAVLEGVSDLDLVDSLLESVEVPR